MAIPRNLLIGYLFFLPLLLPAQVLDYVDVQLRIMEKVDTSTRALPHARLNISDLGEVEADENGQYRFNYPVRNRVDPQISVALLSDLHKTLKPLDGSVVLDPSRETMTIEFLVVNVADESPEFKQRIRELEKRLHTLKSRNELTKRQLNRLNQTLVDTILYFEQNRLAMKIEMEALNSSIAGLEEVSATQQKEIATQQARIELLEEKVDDLTRNLEAALEQRYLRQNEYFRKISTNLNEYLQRLKDLRDQLPYIKDYFKIEGDFERNYNSNLTAYNAAFTALNTGHQDYLEGVERYWEQPELSRGMEDVFKYLLMGVHLRQVFPLVNELNTEIRRNRPNRAQKVAATAYEDLVVNVRKLEKDANRLLTQLRLSL